LCNFHMDIPSICCRIVCDMKPNVYRLTRLCSTLVSLSLLMALSVCTRGQDPTPSSTPVERPMPTNAVEIGEAVAELDPTILHIFRARNRDYWFGSDGAGVFRLVGKKLIRYSTKDGLANNQIRGIQEDDAGHIYFRTLGGISKFDGKCFTTLAVAKTSDDPDDWKLESGDLWFNGTQDENGTFRYDGEALHHLEFPKHPMADNFYAVLPNPPYNPYQVYIVYRDRKGNVWLGTSTFGICRFDGKSLSWMYEDHLSNIGNDRSFGIRSIIEDKNGDFWFCNTRYRYNIGPGSTMKGSTDWIDYRRKTGVGISKVGRNDEYPYFMSVAEDDHGDLWMASFSDGVFRYDGAQLVHYPVKDGDRDITLYSIYKDNQGDLWLGTHQGGAFKFSGQAFGKFKP
jgi:Two component regulator propeller